jgi:hypothetical protein
MTAFKSPGKKFDLRLGGVTKPFRNSGEAF